MTRSMIVCDREFSFPIDLSHEIAVCLTGDKNGPRLAANQVQLLLHSYEIARLTINDTHYYYHEKMNELRADPLRYKVGDIDGI